MGRCGCLPQARPPRRAPARRLLLTADLALALGRGGQARVRAGARACPCAPSGSSPVLTWQINATGSDDDDEAYVVVACEAD